MDQKELRNLADKHQIYLGTLEKDYAITNLLSIIARFPKLDSMVFKGGTAIKKIYFEQFRFSEDLDFTCSGDVSEEFADFIEKEMKTLDVKFTEIAEKERKGESFKFKAKYAQLNGVTASVRLDLSLREDVLTDAVTRPILHFYDALTHDFEVNAMSLEEIMAEKIRAIIYTKHPRHLHDLWYLHEQNVSFKADMVRTKIKTVYGDEFDLDKFRDSIEEKKKNWQKDLRPLLPSNPPPFDIVSKKVLEIVTNAMK
ncbi:MAG: nucleotidyl transferase AbiEii/AbiGii toxin family protein [Thaumarchaeota archaeon]|nr:nucleotidyl transferase AbiEii/AbiGii toxin family protein [Nitrososphaerota archaeon]